MKSPSNYHLSTKETQLPLPGKLFLGASVSECGAPLSNKSVLVLEPFRRKLEKDFKFITLESYKNLAVKDFQRVLQEVVYNAKRGAETYRFLP